MARTKQKGNASTDRYVTNPTTGRAILVGGALYNRLQAAGVDLKPASVKQRLSTAHGCSNATKWETFARTNGIPASEFCGIAAGTGCTYSYPVFDEGHRKAALRWRSFAPDPEGLKACVDAHRIQTNKLVKTTTHRKTK